MVRDDKPALYYHKQDSIPPQFSELEGDELIKALIIIGAPETWIEANTDASSGHINRISQDLLDGTTKPPTEALIYARNRLKDAYQMGLPFSKMKDSLDKLSDMSDEFDNPKELSQHLLQLHEIHTILSNMEGDPSTYEAAEKIQTTGALQTDTRPARIPSMSEAAKGSSWVR